jgi:hypothetical protein
MHTKENHMETLDFATLALINDLEADLDCRDELDGIDADEVLDADA